jgi:ribosomal protein S18 acetylase RimI-like enzyme
VGRNRCVLAQPGVKEDRARCSLGAMYVRDAWRGKGAGDRLVAAVLAHGASEVEQIVLTVNAENGPAIALYERHGFRVYGRLPRSIKVGERYYDELEMIRLEELQG